MVTSTNTSANISAGTSSVMSPEKETVRWTKHYSGQTASSNISAAHSPLNVSSFSPVRRAKQGFQACLRSTISDGADLFSKVSMIVWWSASGRGRRWEGAEGGGSGRGSVHWHWHLLPLSSPFKVVDPFYKVHVVMCLVSDLVILSKCDDLVILLLSQLSPLQEMSDIHFSVETQCSSRLSAKS